METVSFPENIDWYLLFLAKGNLDEWSTDQSNQVSQNLPCSVQRNPRDMGEISPFQNRRSLLPDFSAQEWITVK